MPAPFSDKGSTTMTWTGRILTALTALFMLLDGVMKIVQPHQVLEANSRLAYPVSTLSGIGITLIACTLIYLIPRTAALGAILLTGYLGGAVASNVRAGLGGSRQSFPCFSRPWFGSPSCCGIVGCGTCFSTRKPLWLRTPEVQIR